MIFILIKGTQYEIIEENGIKVYKDHFCRCPCHRRIILKEIHKYNGIPKYINYHQNKSPEIRKKNSDSNKGKIPFNKGLTYEKLYGEERAKKIKEDIGKKSNKNKVGKIYEEIYGKEKTNIIKDKIKNSHIGIHPTSETIENMRKSQLGRKHKPETIEKMKEKRKLQIITEESKQKSREKQLGRTFEEIHGTEKAKELKEYYSKLRKGKTYEEILGKEKSFELKKLRRKTSIKRIEQNNGIAIPYYNFKACEYFKKFDEENKTQGCYAVYGNGEYYITELGYFPDYINFDSKLIMEWDEEYHYENDILSEHDIQRQKEIQEFYPDFEFRRIRERDVI